MSDNKKKLVVEMTDGERAFHESDKGIRYEVRDGCLIVEMLVSSTLAATVYRQVAAYSAHAWKSVYRDDLSMPQ